MWGLCLQAASFVCIVVLYNIKHPEVTVVIWRCANQIESWWDAVGIGRKAWKVHENVSQEHQLWHESVMQRMFGLVKSSWERLFSATFPALFPHCLAAHLGPSSWYPSITELLVDFQWHKQQTHWENDTCAFWFLWLIIWETKTEVCAGKEMDILKRLGPAVFPLLFWF